MDLYAGLMSGTSLDGIDVVVVGFSGQEERPTESELVVFRTFAYESAFRDRLRAACEGGTTAELSALSFELGRRFAASLRETLEDAGLEAGELEAVGSHGQTVWHDPADPGGSGAEEAADDRPENGETPRIGHTLQIGEGAVVAELLGVPVVEDFRVRDVAAGGQGAPLTAGFDRLLLGSATVGRAIQNLGGMGNVTALPPAANDVPPVAFDTGPGVAMLDGAARRLSGGRLDLDPQGRHAARGEVQEEALGEWLDDPYFGAPPPRSTGRERFGEPALAAWLERHPELSLEDALATLTELTARSVAEARRFFGFEIEEMYLCGGGARNEELVRRIVARLDPVPVRPLESLGWDGDAREAAAFALLARQHVLGIPAGLHWATGARGPRVLGKWVPA